MWTVHEMVAWSSSVKDGEKSSRCLYVYWRTLTCVKKRQNVVQMGKLTFQTRKKVKRKKHIDAFRRQETLIFENWESLPKSITFITSAVRKSNCERQKISKYGHWAGWWEFSNILDGKHCISKPINLGCQHPLEHPRKTFYDQAYYLLLRMCIKPPCSSVSSESLDSEYFGNWLGNWFNEHRDTEESMTCSAENANIALEMMSYIKIII